MSFDPSTAQPASKKFDPSSAKVQEALPKPSASKPRGPQQVAPVTHRLQGVDYEEGLSFPVRAALAEADTQKEKLLMLGHVYGKENVKVASDGSLIVKKDGKMIAVEGGSKLKNFAADTLGNFPQLAGTAGGAAAGSSFGPWGTLGGAVIGSMLGKEMQEGKKLVQGNYDKTTKEEIKTVAKAGEEGAAGELGGRVITGTVSRLLRGRVPTALSGVTPETQAMTERTVAGGARPQAQATLPDMKHIQFMEALAAKTVGTVKKQAAANSNYIAGRMQDILKDAGIPVHQIDATIKELASGESKIPTSEVGEHVKLAVQAHREMLEKQVDNALRVSNTEIDAALNQMNKVTNRAGTEGLAVDAARGIEQARATFSQSFERVYGKIDSMVGGQPLVPSFGINKVAQDILARAPPAIQQQVTRDLASIGIDLGKTAAKSGEKAWQQGGAVGASGAPAIPKISFSQAQRIRTLLRERMDGGLTPGIAEHEWGELASATDQAIQLAAHDSVAAPAVKILNKADVGYANGIAKFKDSTIQGLVRDMKAGLPANPETVAAKIIQPGQEARVKAIRSLIGPDAWNKVKGADYSNMIQSARDATGNVNGLKLLKAINERGGLMEEIYGANAKDLRELATAMAARDGALPPGSLLPGKIKDTVVALKNEEKALNDFMQKNSLSVLSNPKMNPEAAYEWLVRPNNGQSLGKAIKLLGEDSPQVAGIRQAALKELLTNTKMSLASKNSSDALSKALNKYTAEQQKLLFPHGMADDLHLLGKETEFIMRSLSDEAKATFAAGFILGQPFFTRVPMQIPIAFYQNILSQPATIKYLALGLRSPAGPARQASKEILKDMIVNGTLTADPDTRKEGQPK